MHNAQRDSLIEKINKHRFVEYFFPFAQNSMKLNKAKAKSVPFLVV